MKIIDGILVIISVIAFVGALLAAYVLLQVGATLNSLPAIAGFGGVEGLQDAVSMFNMMITFGWIWVIAVVLSSLYAIWVGVQRIREKGK